jgi:transposase
MNRWTLKIVNEISTSTTSSRRTRYPLEFKLRIVEASFAPGASIARVAREHGLNANQLFNWRYQYRHGQLGTLATPPALFPVALSDTPIPPSPAVPVSRDQIERVLPKGRLVITGRPDTDTLHWLIQVLSA